MSSSRTSAVIVLLMLATWLLVHLLQPRIEPTAPGTRLADGVPAQLGSWHWVEASGPVQISSVSDGAIAAEQIYDQQLLRTYRNAQGQQLMLTLAYLNAQDHHNRVHDPMGCYPASGFEILQTSTTRLQRLETPSMQPLIAQRLLARRGSRTEAVSYWIRMGTRYSASSMVSRLYLAQERLHGRAPDGILVRASLLVNDEAAATTAHETLEGFLAELLAGSSPAVRTLLLR